VSAACLFSRNPLPGPNKSSAGTAASSSGGALVSAVRFQAGTPGSTVVRKRRSRYSSKSSRT